MTNILNQYFDKIYCINLDRRPDKWKESQDEFIKHGLDVERFSAIDGRLLSGNGRISTSELGCSMSHYSILKSIIDNDYKRTLILEDDVEFIDNMSAYFNQNISSIPQEWDMLYLGGNHIEKPVYINDIMCKISKTYTTSHYGITSDMASRVIYMIDQASEQVDVVYTRFHPDNLCYSFCPAIAWQRPGFSDVQNRYQDYRYCMKPNK